MRGKMRKSCGEVDKKSVFDGLQLYGNFMFYCVLNIFCEYSYMWKYEENTYSITSYLIQEFFIHIYKEPAEYCSFFKA